jgi:hypothetical protein
MGHILREGLDHGVDVLRVRGAAALGRRVMPGSMSTGDFPAIARM